MIFESNWNFSVNDYHTMTLYENPSLNLKFFMRNETNICRNFFLNNCMRYLRAFIEFFRQTDNYCLVFIEISKLLRNALYARRSGRTERGRRGIKLSILKLMASNDSDARLNGTDWFRASISKRRSMDLDTELYR